MKQLWEAADFVRNLRRRLRFGELSRAPLKLLRLELRGNQAAPAAILRGDKAGKPGGIPPR